MSWVTVAVTAAVTGAGASAYGSYQQGKEIEKQRPEFLRAPEFEESKEARGDWWNTLQEWGQDPGYGAIQPDWADIWQQAEQKVNQFYEGTSMAPGAIDAVKASASARGVSESPAREKLIGRMKIAQGEQIKDLGSEQNLAKAKLSESGRQTWLESLQSLAGQKPTSQMYTPPPPGPNKWQMGGQFLGGVAGLAGAMPQGGGGAASAPQTVQNPWNGQPLNNAQVAPYQSYATGGYGGQQPQWWQK